MSHRSWRLLTRRISKAVKLSVRFRGKTLDWRTSDNDLNFSSNLDHGGSATGGVVVLAVSF